jgi:hypothetical protein
MQPVPAQQWTGMMGGGVADSGIGIGPAPSQNGGAVDDEIARTDEAAANRHAHRHAHRDDEQCLGHWSANTRRSFPLLRGTGRPGGSLSVEWEATGERERGPTDDPIVHVLIGEAPERPQQGEQQQ